MRLGLVLLCAALPLAAQLHTLSKEMMEKLTAKNPYGRFEDGRPKIPDNIIERARGLSIEEIWGTLPNKGYCCQFEGGWKIMHPGAKLLGRAVTVQFMPTRPDINEHISAELKARGAKGGQHQWVIDQLQPGDVLVADMFGKIEGGTIVGDNLAMAIYGLSRNGFVVDGAIRDMEGIHPIGMQIYMRGSHPSAIKDVMVTGYNIPVRIGQATVMPGDLVFADRGGIYFVPPQFIEEILDRADETHIHDEWTKAKLATGKWKSSDLYPRPKDPAMQKEYDEYLAEQLKKMGKTPRKK